MRACKHRRKHPAGPVYTNPITHKGATQPNVGMEWSQQLRNRLGGITILYPVLRGGSGRDQPAASEGGRAIYCLLLPAAAAAATTAGAPGETNSAVSEIRCIDITSAPIVSSPPLSSGLGSRWRWVGWMVLYCIASSLPLDPQAKFDMSKPSPPCTRGALGCGPTGAQYSTVQYSPIQSQQKQAQAAAGGVHTYIYRRADPGEMSPCLTLTSQNESPAGWRLTPQMLRKRPTTSQTKIKRLHSTAPAEATQCTCTNIPHRDGNQRQEKKQSFSRGNQRPPSSPHRSNHPLPPVPIPGGNIHHSPDRKRPSPGADASPNALNAKPINQASKWRSHPPCRPNPPARRSQPQPASVTQPASQPASQPLRTADGRAERRPEQKDIKVDQWQAICHATLPS
jgi:hypothetical protein